MPSKTDRFSRRQHLDKNDMSYLRKVTATRRWIEMVGELHQLGYGRLRLASSWENAGPAPVWFGDIAPGIYFRRDHGAILACHPWRNNVETLLPNDLPMFSSRRAARPDYPWEGFMDGSINVLAEQWLSRYPQLAATGVGEDAAYVTWYSRMLDSTSPAGIICASYYWEEPPGYMYVTCGPEGCDRFDLPPPGLASSD